MMKKASIFAAAICSFLAINAYMGGASSFFASAESVANEFPCSYSAATKDSSYVCYGSSAVLTYTAEDAAAADVPTGYTGQVLEVQPISASVGVLLDFSEQNIPIDLVESLEFRIYVPENSANTGSRPQARIAYPGKVNSDWVYQPGSTPTPQGEWTTVTVAKTSKFSALADADGELYKFEFSVRSAAKISFYIDEIKVNVKADDGVAPEIRYNGADTIYANEGATLDISATAYDVGEAREVDVAYDWDKTPFDGNGKLVQGTYVLTMTAQDYYKNTSTRTVTLVVREADREAPVIELKTTEMYATVGTIPVLTIQATDNSGSVIVTQTWSEGALDKRGALTEGTHTLTVTATDPSGNTTTKTVIVYVTTEENLGENVVDEEAKIPRYTVTFDDENATEYKQGSKIKKPETPTAPDENSTFVGWFVGETEWNFETDVVTANINLTAKWQKNEIPESSASRESSESSVAESSSVSGEGSSSVGNSSGTSDSESNDKKTSCFGSIGGLVVVPTLLGAAVLLRKKERDE